MNSAKHKVLCVDDDVCILRLLEKIFTPQYEVWCAHSGVEAIEMLKDQKFALILSDQRMPGISGLELMFIVNQIQPKAFKIIMTGLLDENALQEALGKGFIDLHITKPWSNEFLKKQVNYGIEMHGLRELIYS